MDAVPGSPIDRLLTVFLLIAPVGYLLTDLLYALQGWDDPIAGLLHVLFATAYGLVVLRVVTLTTGRPGWSLAVLLVGVVGTVGNAAYGFETLHVSLGDTALVDAAGAANLIKPLGLAFPLTLVLAAVALVLTGRISRTVGAALGVAGLVWPVAHIANIGWLAVVVNVVLVGVFAELWRSIRVGASRSEPVPA